MAIYASFYFPLKSISLNRTALTFVDGQSEVFSATESRLCATFDAFKEKSLQEFIFQLTRLSILPLQLKRPVLFNLIPNLQH